MKSVLATILFVVLSATTWSQTITTIAGQGTSFADGIPATNAKFANPGYLVFDKKGNMYFSDVTAHKIQKISTDGIITTVAGIGMLGSTGDGGLATAARLHQPASVAVDSVGNIYISDNANHKIRKVDAITNIITTVIGSVSGYGGDGGPASSALLRMPSGICFDKYGNLYIADAGNLRVRKVNTEGIITTVAGTGVAGWGGDGGPATAAKCFPWVGICTDDIGNLYFAEWSWGVIRKVNASGIISTVAGDTTTPHLYNGDNIAATTARIDASFVIVDKDGTLYISDSYNHRIRKVGTDGIITTIAGNGTGSSTGDNGPATNATVHTPSGLVLDSCGNLFFGQVNTPRIRKIALNPDCKAVAVKDVEKTNGTSLRLYPNPAHTQLTISTTEPITSLCITNVLGQVVAAPPGLPQGEVIAPPFLPQGEVTIPVGHLPKGVYVVRVNGLYVQRFVKE